MVSGGLYSQSQPVLELDEKATQRELETKTIISVEIYGRSDGLHFLHSYLPISHWFWWLGPLFQPMFQESHFANRWNRDGIGVSMGIMDPRSCQVEGAYLVREFFQNGITLS